MASEKTMQEIQDTIDTQKEYNGFIITGLAERESFEIAYIMIIKIK